MKIIYKDTIATNLPDDKFARIMTLLLKLKAVSDDTSDVFFDIYSRAAICKSEIYSELGFRWCDDYTIMDPLGLAELMSKIAM